MTAIHRKERVDIETTSIYDLNANAWLDKKRRALNEGGTSSSKTYSILQLLILITQHAKKPLLVSVVSESLPHLKRGAIRDFMNIMADDFIDQRYNRTEHTYNFGKGKLEFFPADEPSKMRGGRRDILFLNEANNVYYEAYRELDIRTRLFTFMDWNPVSEFWAHEQGLIRRPENAYIHSTYMDALDVLPQQVIDNIESNRDTDPNWWNVYGLGKLGKVEGLVYPFLSQVNELPGGDIFYGLDFGFSTDVTALVKCVIKGDSLYCQELIYERGLTNQDIADRMMELEIEKHSDEIFAESAEPKSIEEIYQRGFNIKPCPKGPGSVEYGHQKVRQYKLYWTQDSLNGIKEQRNFRYLPDKNGKLTDKTAHIFSHAMDARRYAVVGSFEPVPREEILVYDAMQAVNMDL